ncbi:MAG: putative porin [Candidatus Aminicenantes bacterium]|nr:putative porin [Candidatus Aminicenantes bacterium]
MNREKIQEKIRKKTAAVAAVVLLAALLPGQAGAGQAGAGQEKGKKYEFYGDFRFRGEYDTNRSEGREGRFRERVRLRLGILYKTGVFTLGARLVTGNAADPNSTHQTLGTMLNRFSLSLDRAFVTFKPGKIPLWITAGKFSHPFKTGGIYNELVWDGDVSPEGIAAGYTSGGKKIKWGLIAGDYRLVERNNETDTSLFAGQFFVETTASRIVVLAACGLYEYRNLNVDGQAFADNAGNFAGEPERFASRFSIMDALLQIGVPGRRPVFFSLQYFKNFAAVVDRDEGYALGCSVGRTQGPGDYKVYYQYQVVEQDAVFSPFSQDDFLQQTNFGGHLFGVKYNVASSVNLNLWGLLSKMDFPRAGEYQVRFRLDLNIKF